MLYWHTAVLLCIPFFRRLHQAHEFTLIGYARISTQEQYLDLQVEALHAAGCIRFFKDEAPGGAAKGPPPGLARALEALGAGDTLVVWRLDRLGRSLRELVRRVEAVQARQAGVRSLHEGIDTTGAGRAACGAGAGASGRPAQAHDAGEGGDGRAPDEGRRDAGQGDLRGAGRVEVDAVPVRGAGWECTRNVREP